jgi:hypothetical protein
MKLGFSILSFVLVVTLGQPVLACSCYFKLQKEEALSESENVFLAKVVGVEPTSVTIPARPEYNQQERSIRASQYTLQTVSQFKGVEQASFQILSRKTSCFVDLKPGQQYVVYLRANSSGGLPEIGTCDRIVPVENGREDLEYLQNRTAP